MFSCFLLFNWGGKAPNRYISEESGGLTFCFFSEGFIEKRSVSDSAIQNYCSAVDRYYSFPVVKQNIEEELLDTDRLFALSFFLAWL